MKAKFWKFLLNRFQLTSKKRQKAGFTLLELLISTIIGFIIITALLSFIVDLLQTDRKEFANSETQREMQMALDFIADDLREAVYIYDNTEQSRKVEAVTADSLKNVLGFPNEYRPILAFWKVERIPYNNPEDTEINCGGSDECKTLEIRRRSYTLVVYFQVKNPPNDPKWKGKSRIVRYALRKYKDVNSLAYNNGYADPKGKDSKTGKYTSPALWPFDVSGSGKISTGGSPEFPPGGPPVLVDFVDDPNIAPIQANEEMKTCNSNNENSPLFTPPGEDPHYKRVPEKADDSSSSFFVCVKTVDSVKLGANQDAIIYLRGNVDGKVPGQKTSKSNPLITLRTQAFARGVIDKIIGE
ncbi:prepilin-type N-terminal cleavage/methylation domain-containing protein [Aerosakkonemataceae cyanobacterium BLCC-F154]|uniref:Prepilin-type N-terminal cleavage/methylation domain-containing protein n=1 Tax=Floridaenema fluviatile BLCC-F154 TaxID=3153640 RepID=A0ABV4YEM3_9CYAN